MTLNISTFSMTKLRIVYSECHNAVFCIVMSSVIRLSAVILNVMAPKCELGYDLEKWLIPKTTVGAGTVNFFTVVIISVS
jgi:hypothetical protein